MKHLFLATSIFIIASFACNSNKVDAVSNSELAAKNVAASSATGNAVFSYNLDGTKISGGEVDELVMNNAAFVTKSDNGNKLSFFLNDAYKNNTETFSHSLRFQIPDKTGTVALTPDDDNWHVELFLATGEGSKYVLYGNKAFTVTVTNVSSTRVSGTFSGQEKLAESTGSGKSELNITDGKFDIPVRDTK